MATITHVFTIARVAEMLGVDEDRLHEIAIEMEPEDGVMHVYGIDDDGIMAFTDFGVENLRELGVTGRFVQNCTLTRVSARLDGLAASAAR